MWSRPESNAQSRANSRISGGAHSRSAKAQMSCRMREMFDVASYSVYKDTIYTVFLQ